MLIRFFNMCLWLSGICVFCLVWGFMIEPTLLKTRQVTNGHDKFGDRSDEFNAALQAGMGHLSALSAPMGVYASIGNHDDWYNQAAIRTNLAKARVHVLENASKDLEGRLCVAGLADHWTGEPDPSAIEQCPDGLPVIAFMHSPDTFPILPTRTSLALAGHTHGGQINLPILGRRVTAIKLDRKYAYGLSKYRGIPVYVTSGIGTSMLPARFRAPPEIVILQLR